MSFKSGTEPQRNRGSIRLTRIALGLTLDSIAKRTGIRRQNVHQFEISEERGQIKLANLRRIAEAMDCELVYTIVPKQTARLTRSRGIVASDSCELLKDSLECWRAKSCDQRW